MKRLGDIQSIALLVSLLCLWGSAIITDIEISMLRESVEQIETQCQEVEGK